jgi:c-di-GMP-binding flagellar brake protein YcgR
MSEQKDQRNTVRFEPALLDAIIRLQNREEMKGRVLDSSEGGMAIALSEGAELPPVETTVEVSVIIDNASSSTKPVGNAIIKRNWEEKGFLDEGKGIALEYTDGPPKNGIRKVLLRGIRQKTRLESQRELAMADMGFLGNYRRDLVECQTKLFLLSLTIGVTDL